MPMRSILPTALLLALATGCAADLSPNDDDGGPVVVDERGGPNVGHVDEGDGVIATRVDATSEEAWVYLDLDEGLQLDVDDPRTEPDWELAFMRFHIKLNGGASGTAGVEIAILEDVAFEDVDVAPADGYIRDLPDGDDENEEPDYALQDWYDYDIMTHVLTPRPVVYVLRTDQSRHYKLQIDTYYDEAGTSGHMQFRWAWIEGP